ncbi:hypothetical protein [[Clostridium] colinum]|uniref:hypothetical protein n=1 Tax=[Clostridium] colinum TaxID=36835 RepID=UPI00202506AA|nr:hypothetical protein [[Clostridium] colinum]
MKEKLKYLRWFDILIVTIILFGKPIYDSTVIFLTANANEISEVTDINTLSNIYSIFYEIIQLSLAFFIFIYVNLIFHNGSIK